ncbi:MAG: hypothetical protein JJE04_12525 [Acidobacteriia bacterium]|nr:hypothetical protein [Terriglobia bacterium]
MTRQRKARILTLILMSAALGFILFKNSGRQAADLIPSTSPKPDPTPQDAVYAMLDAARDGNLSAYLASFTGQMETALRQSIAEQGETAFARYLKDSNSSIKGIAINEPQTLTDREVKLRVEYVFQDRNEIQFFYLEKQAKDWKIARLDSAERVKTLIPYGTPVQ